MAVLINAKVLELTPDNCNISSRNSIYLVIPLIKSFSAINETIYQVYSCVNEDLNLKKSSSEIEDFYGVKYYNIVCYTILYKDTTSNENKRIVFEKYEDADEFLYELKLSINEFYKNPEAYVKFIN